MKNLFYVYEHWRPDTDVCFYVGKGKGKRAYSFYRNTNSYYNRIVRKLSSLGMCVEVRMVGNGLEEIDALRLEIDRISFWRSCGCTLANLTDGGEGSSGFKHSKKTRKKMSLIRKGRTISAITRQKMSLWRTGRKFGPHSEEHKAKIAAKSKGRTHTKETCQILSYNQKNRPKEYWDRVSKALKGRPLTPEHREKLRVAHLGFSPSQETRKKLGEASKAVPRTDAWRKRISKSVKASWHKRADRPGGMIGKKFSAESRKKMSDARKAYYAKRRQLASIEVQ